MKKSIDEMSAELTKEFSAKEMSFPEFEKALPPKLAYRFRKWLNSFAYRQTSGTKVEDHVKSAIDDLVAGKTLQKNEAMISFYDSGIIKMDFGSAVNPKIKEAAMQWAKKRGLKAVEASLAKSAKTMSQVVFGDSSKKSGICVKRLKFS